MNTYLEMQIKNMLIFIDGFEKACQLAVLKDDGKIDRTEERQLRKIRAAAARFKKELDRLQ